MMLLDLKLPSFNAILHNACLTFNDDYCLLITLQFQQSGFLISYLYFIYIFFLWISVVWFKWFWF